MTRTILLLSCAASVAACGGAGETDQNITVEEESASTIEGEVALMAPSGERIGTVAYVEEASGMQLRVTVDGLAAGEHAVHLHETGVCDIGDFTSAGGHWNPMGNEHGRDNPAGAHLGDLANMSVGEFGTGSATYIVTGVSFSGGEPAMSDADGTALVIHEGADDYVTDPTGDAGGRAACAVLAAPA